MGKVAIHQYKRGKHPSGGKYTHYEVVSGSNPFGPHGGRGGRWVDGKLRKHFWSKDKAREYALNLAAMECLEFIDSYEDKENDLELLQHEAALPREAAVSEPEMEYFDPDTVIDTRRKKLIKGAARPGQKRFREQVLNAYSFVCSATGCSVKEALDAAHIHPYLGSATNHLCNGILLRADIHKLFDGFLVAIDESYNLRVSHTIRDTEYGSLHERRINLPHEERGQPSKKALDLHYAEFCRLERYRKL